MRKVKICGIKDPETAFFSAQCGADLIGIIQHPPSPRYVDLSLAKEIAHAAKEGGARAVAVFVNMREEEIVRRCEEIGCTMVQLYAQTDLPEQFDKIIVNDLHFPLREGRDFLLLDHAEGGKGVPLDWKNLAVPHKAPWFLAGGLDVHNIEEALALCDPVGVDISSGVERAGQKNLHLIEEFVVKARGL
jgi:phosphoribosylanthranilate isomerase